MKTIDGKARSLAGQTLAKRQRQHGAERADDRAAKRRGRADEGELRYRITQVWEWLVCDELPVSEVVGRIQERFNVGERQAWRYIDAVRRPDRP